MFVKKNGESKLQTTSFKKEKKIHSLLNCCSYSWKSVNFKFIKRNQNYRTKLAYLQLRFNVHALNDVLYKHNCIGSYKTQSVLPN